MVSSDFVDDYPRLSIWQVIRATGSGEQPPVSVGIHDLVGRELGTVGAERVAGGIWLTFDLPEHHLRVVETVATVTTFCPVGGERQWWLCPACGRRCAKIIFAHRPSIACCRCLRLPYRSQWAGSLETAAVRVARATRRLGADHRRPPGMRLKTFARLRDTEVMAETELRRKVGPLWKRVLMA